MSTQPRQRAGTRRSGVSAGGRFTNKTVPTVKDDTIGFDAPKCGWTERTVKVFGTKTTFTRTVDTDGVVSVATDCDPPDMLLTLHTRVCSAKHTGWNYYKNPITTAAPVTMPLLL